MIDLAQASQEAEAVERELQQAQDAAINAALALNLTLQEIVVLREKIAWDAALQQMQNQTRRMQRGKRR